jgi:hypothetical protein
MSTKLPHQRHESSLFRQIDDEREDAMQRQGENTVSTVQSSAEIASRKRIVESPERKAFRLPAGLEKLLGVESKKEIQELLYDIYEINESMVGETLLDAYILLNGSLEEDDVIERGFAWARAYVARRVDRSNPRDQGCPYRRFLRLQGEMVPRLEKVGGGEDLDSWVTNVGPVLLDHVCRLISWSFFESTWMDDVEWFDDGQCAVHPRADVDADVLASCHNLFALHQWWSAHEFDVLMSEIGTALAESGCDPASDREERAAVELLADNIHQMKPFIVRNFQSSEAVVELPGGRLAWFNWATGRRLGLLKIANPGDKASSTTPDHFTLSLGFGGRLECTVNPWRTAATVDIGSQDIPPLTVNRVVLESVHDKLFSFYDPIDVESILARWKAAEPAEPASVEEEDEVIAASIAIAARLDSDEGERRSTARIVSHLRLNQLRKILEGRLGCTARPGKGSELLVHRPGGQIAVVGRHKANPTVSAPGVRRILKRLGIGVSEWIDATG